jgi:hypothetical protein
MDEYRGMSVGTVMQYENGYIAVPNYTAAAAFGPDGRMIKRWGNYAAPKEGPDPGAPDNSGQETHYENFVKAVRSRKASDLSADIIEDTFRAPFATRKYLTPARQQGFAGRDPREDQRKQGSRGDAWTND